MTEANQVIIHFEKAEDALRFTMAAGMVMSATDPLRENEAATMFAREFRKAWRITVEGEVNPARADDGFRQRRYRNFIPAAA